jgi:hypothetical protein
MARSIEALGNPQPGLFEQGEPDITLAPAQRQRLAPLIEALLLEIAVALATREVGDDEDHR